MDVALMLFIAFVLLVVSWFVGGGARGLNGNSSTPPYNDSWGAGGDGGSGGDAGCDGGSSS